MADPHDPQSEIPRDAASASEISRNETAPQGAPEPSRTIPGASVRVTDDGITEVGFDDPELRPLPADKLHYHVPHPDPHPESHEHSDVPIRPLAVTLAAIAGTCLFTFVLLYFVFWHFKGQQESAERPRTGVPMARPVVPGPRLQGVPGFSDNHPREDLAQMRERYAAGLKGYGVNDGAPPGAPATAPTARIPIDRAMELALERKIFPVAGKAPAGANPTTRPATGAATRPTTRGANR